MISAYNRFNEMLARKLSPLLLSMTVFWILTAGFVLGLVRPAFLLYFQALSSNWYQGIALPIIGLSGGIAAMETMKLIRETHAAVMEMHESHDARLNSLHEKHDALHTKHDALHSKIESAK